MGDVATRGYVILFVCAFVGCVVWSCLYLLFASNYYLATLIDSSAGHEEVHYPDESIVDWWWKPIFCVWILAFWIITGSILLSPFLAASPLAFTIALGTLLWFMYPLSIFSALYTSNWLFFVHPILLWRMLKHYPSLVYVQFMTLAAALLCSALLAGTFLHSFIWMLPAAFVIPAAILFYGRVWGRFAWVALNFKPRKAKAKAEFTQAAFKNRPGDDAPEMDVQEVDDAAAGLRAGLPPAYPHAIQTAAPGARDGIAVGAPPLAVDADEENLEKPYGIVGSTPQFSYVDETAKPLPVPSAQATTLPFPVVEEEDEWSTDKKPYVVIDAPTPADRMVASGVESTEPDQPVTVTQHTDEIARKQKQMKKKVAEDAATRFLPTPSKKTPTFEHALWFGVWNFMIEPRTLRVATNLVFLTIVELFFLFMIVQFWPRLD